MSFAAGPNGLVAAYNFEEGAGSTATDASGNGNTGTLVNATWTTSGKYGKALSFNGTSARVDVANAPSLQLTSATLEAWVNPSTVPSAWRDVIMKGNDNYYLMGTTTLSGRPAAGAVIGGAHAEAFGTAGLPIGTYEATATQSATRPWLIHVVTFRAAGH